MHVSSGNRSVDRSQNQIHAVSGYSTIEKFFYLCVYDSLMTMRSNVTTNTTGRKNLKCFAFADAMMSALWSFCEREKVDAC
jgi:hypothetical protein